MTHINLQDLLHVWAVLSVAFLIFGTKENILNTFFDGRETAILKTPDPQNFIEKLDAKLEARRDEIEQQATKIAMRQTISVEEFPVYGDYESKETAIKKLKEKLKYIDQIKQKRINKIHKDARKNYKTNFKRFVESIHNRFVPKYEKISKKFSSSCIYLGLTSFLYWWFCNTPLN